MVVEVEERVADGPALHRGDQGRDALAIVGRQGGDFEDLKMAKLNKSPRKFLARKHQRARPRLILFLKSDEGAVGVEQEMQLFERQRLQTASIRSRPCRMASARSRTNAG